MAGWQSTEKLTPSACRLVVLRRSRSGAGRFASPAQFAGRMMKCLDDWCVRNDSKVSHSCLHLALALACVKKK